MSLEGAGRTSQDGVNMASKWRIDGVFWRCALKKWGQVGLRVNLYSMSILLTVNRMVPRKIKD